MKHTKRHSNIFTGVFFALHVDQTVLSTRVICTLTYVPGILLKYDEKWYFAACRRCAIKFRSNWLVDSGDMHVTDVTLMSHHSPAAEVCPEIEPRKKNMYWQSRAECLLHMFRPNVFPLQLNELCNQDCCPAAQATYCSSDLLPGQQLRVRVLLPLSMYQVALLVQLPRLLSSLLLQNSRGRLENTHTHYPVPLPSGGAHFFSRHTAMPTSFYRHKQQGDALPVQTYSKQYMHNETYLQVSSTDFIRGEASGPPTAER